MITWLLLSSCYAGDKASMSTIWLLFIMYIKKPNKHIEFHLKNIKPENIKVEETVLLNTKTKTTKASQKIFI